MAQKEENDRFADDNNVDSGGEDENLKKDHLEKAMKIL